MLASKHKHEGSFDVSSYGEQTYSGCDVGVGDAGQEPATNTQGKTNKTKTKAWQRGTGATTGRGGDGGASQPKAWEAA